jgi:hypothetical protein
MWQLQNDTPFMADRTWVRDMQGAEVWIVAVKGTFAIKSNGATELAEKQEEICRAPQYMGEPGQSSLKYDADLALAKLTTDIILHGHAHAPRGRLTTSVDVTLKVGRLTKTLRVFGPRFWRKGYFGLKKSRPEPFDKMPIVYEHAFGGADQRSDDPRKHGWEWRNPVGVGFAMKKDHLSDQRLPNVEYPNELISHWKMRPSPAGFGPIACSWSPRVEQAGSFDESWENERKPLPPLDFGERYYQCAPLDQQPPGFLNGGEPVELHNMTPEGSLRFTLPRVTLGFATQIAGGIEWHRANLHTVIIEPAFPRVILVWHTSLSCHKSCYTLKKTTVFEKQII